MSLPPSQHLVTARPVRMEGSVVARPLGQELAGDAMLLPGIPRRAALWQAIGLVGLFVVMMVGAVPFQLLAMSLAPDIVAQHPGIVITAWKWVEALTAVAVIYAMLTGQGLSWRALGLHTGGLARQFGWGLLGWITAMPVVVITGLAVGLLAQLLGWSLEEQAAQRLEFVGALPTDSLWAGLLLMIAVAVHEELLFRGILIPWFRRALGDWWAGAIASALVFALLHFAQGILAIPQVLVLALLWSVLFVLTRSLLAIMVAHLLFNMSMLAFMTYFLIPMQRELGLQPPTTQPVHQLSMLAALWFG